MRGAALGVTPLSWGGSQGCMPPQVPLDGRIIINCIVYLFLDPQELLGVRPQTHGATLKVGAFCELSVLQESCRLGSPLTNSAAWGNMHG